MILKNFENIRKEPNDKYFLFCGAPNLKLIRFILETYDRIDTSSRVHLYLVVNGKKESLDRMHAEIGKMKNKDFIKTFSRLPYADLVQLYLGAIGLLIPLRNNFRDIARFPHKIGEYTAAGNPIITTNYGEIKNYFKDQETALIANDYDVDQFAKKLEFVVDQPEQAKQIGFNGHQVGLEHFNYESYGIRLKEFMRSLRGK